MCLSCIRLRALNELHSRVFFFISYSFSSRVAHVKRRRPWVVHYQIALKVGIAQLSFLLYYIVKSQSLTPVISRTNEYSDMSLCMGGKIRL